MEVWKPVPSDLRYEASNLGRIRAVGTGRVRKLFVTPKGYRTLGVFVAGKVVHRQVHRLVCEAFHGQQPSGRPIVCHNDGNPGNNVPDNLRWATMAENSADRLRHYGIAPRPKPTRARTKLSDADVAAIRAAPRDYGVGARLAKQYGVSVAHIHKLRCRKMDIRVSTPWPPSP